MKQIIVLLCLVLYSIPGMALRVELSSDTFGVSGRSANRNLFVTNNSQKMVALEVYAQSRKIDPNTGVDHLENVESFLIYPNQLLLQPSEQQVVTITWVGEQKLATEQAFRLIVGELNLALDEPEESDGKMSVKLGALTKVVKAAYVTPSKARAQVVVAKTDIIETKEGKRLRLTLHNQGTAHKILKQTAVRVVPVGKDGSPINKQAKEYVPTELKGVLNILAKGQRVVDIAWPEGLDASYSKVNVSL